MSYYKYHVFFCCNQREQGKACCNNHGAHQSRDYAKGKIKDLGLKPDRPGGVRVNQAGCMERCKDGPVLVIYPEAVWYTYANNEDIDEILREHIQHGRVVERLVIK